MRIEILTLFPEMFGGFFDHSIIGRARESGLLDLRLVQWRNYATDRHRVVDDAPYGGGAGMVLKCEPLFRAVEDLRPKGEEGRPPRTQAIFMTPQGEVFTQKVACELARTAQHLMVVCGHYEGIDERAREALFDREISIGDYVLTGGELPAAVVVDAVTRLLPGVVGNQESLLFESHMSGLLDCPHYTRPEVFRSMVTPSILLGGHHAKIEAWRRRQALKRTLLARPDLIETADLSEGDRQMLRELREGLQREQQEGERQDEE
ncbi:MAG TPA: tRNA (guanosine(37)-N1)-methyltransferase TrmD [Sumerlaeia bacterium]|nr:tRNA (guanosine(37)-N1)-methyltransferase TrmD [Sumerlaeia bacterium]